MSVRIPHTRKKITVGRTTGSYLKAQKRSGYFYFHDFFSRLDALHPQGRFLEIGPGAGYLTSLVQEKYHPDEITGLEPSAEMIQAAEEYFWVKRETGRIHYIRGVVEDTELVKSMGRFDFIYSTFSLHHWSDPARAISNLYGALKDGGVFFLYDFYRGGLLYYLKLKRGVWESIRASYRPKELRLMLDSSGIEDYDIRRKGLYIVLTARKGLSSKATGA